MVWKHSYSQVPRSQLDRMRSHSKHMKPCLNMDAGWCNVANKQPPGYSEQMIAAYHNSILVYAYKAALNPNLGKTQHGPYLSTTNSIVDRCTGNRGIRPSITYSSGPFDYFDKHSPENFRENCDTMYGGYNKDCRWENCGLPPSISSRPSHVQMTVVIYIR